MSSKACPFLIGWDVHNASTAKAQSVSLHDVLQHHISVFWLWDLLDSSECKRNSPSKSSSLSLFLLVKETDCWPLGWYKVGRWEGNMAAAQKNPNRLLLFNMLPNAEVQKPSVYPLLFIFIFESLWSQCKVFGSNGHLQSQYSNLALRQAREQKPRVVHIRTMCSSQKRAIWCGSASVFLKPVNFVGT